MSDSECQICGRSVPQPAKALGVCVDCVWAWV